MKRCILAVALLLPLQGAVSQEAPQESPTQQQPETKEQLPPPPLTHQDATRQLIDLLQQTEACLASCRDEASVRAALPELKRLARLAQHITVAQQNLPEPTTQDYIAAQQLAGPFNTAWEAIRAHIDRLEKSHLISPEMRAILCIEEPTETTQVSREKSTSCTHA